MPNQEDQKKIPQELMDISFPRTPAQIEKDEKTPEQVIAASKVDDIFRPNGLQGTSIFQHAAMHRPENAILMLAKNDVRPEQVHLQDLNGQTALHHAAHKKHGELVKAIIDFEGTTPEHLQLANSKGDTPLKILQETGQTELAEYLREKINNPTKETDTASSKPGGSLADRELAKKSQSKLRSVP